jgi:hypothetical protein
MEKLDMHSLNLFSGHRPVINRLNPSFGAIVADKGKVNALKQQITDAYKPDTFQSTQAGQMNEGLFFSANANRFLGKFLLPLEVRRDIQSAMGSVQKQQERLALYYRFMNVKDDAGADFVMDCVDNAVRKAILNRVVSATVQQIRNVPGTEHVIVRVIVTPYLK